MTLSLETLSGRSRGAHAARRRALHAAAAVALLGNCLTLLGCGSSAPAVVHTADIMPQVTALGTDIHTAGALNTRARRLAAGLVQFTSPAAVAPLHVVLHKQHTLLVAADAGAELLARQAAENNRALGLLENSARAAKAAAAAALAGQQRARHQRDAAEARYQNAWLGGKTRKLIAWIIGLGLLVVVGDFLLSAIFGVGFNPLEWIFSLARAAHGTVHA